LALVELVAQIEPLRAQVDLIPYSQQLLQQAAVVVVLVSHQVKTVSLAVLVVVELVIKISQVVQERRDKALQERKVAIVH
jgi:hypothetical protein